MTDGVDKGKRQALIAATAGVAGVGTIAMVKHPFVDSWKPNAASQAAGGPVDVDISALNVGDTPLVVEWRRRPIWIFRRGKDVTAELTKVEGELADPESKKSDQPEYATNQTRSIRPDVGVLVGVCTHLGCSPTYQAVATDNAMKGFFCPCHGSKFDMAGRVAKSVPAPTNLAVPPYYFIDDNTLRIGEDPVEGAA